MRNTKRRHRWLALALCLCLLASVFPLSGMTYAAAQGCNHVHDKDCGYIAAAGSPCTFRHTPHDDTCGYAEARDASPCSVEAAHIHDATCGGNPDTGEGCTFAHVHDDTCGYAEARDATPCSVEAAHVHDENCGYVKAAAGSPCTHVHDADCGGLAKDSGPVLCTKTEDCKLPAGHEGDCETEQHSENGPLVKTVIGWTFVDGENLSEGELALLDVSMDHQANFDTVVSMLPKQISAEVEGGEEPVTLDLSWSCPEYKQDGNWPLTGEYTFMAALPQGYACDSAPTVRVALPGEIATLAAGCTCTVPCLKGAVNGDCPVCSGQEDTAYQSCGGYSGYHDTDMLRILKYFGFSEEYADASKINYLIFHGVLKYGENNHEQYITELNLSKEKLDEVIPRQGPLSGRLFFGRYSPVSNALISVDCTGQDFTEADLLGCEGMDKYGAHLMLAGNPIRSVALPNGSSLTVQPYSGGTVRLKTMNYIGRSGCSFRFEGIPDEGYQFVCVDGTSGNYIYLDLFPFPPEYASVTPVFARTAPETGYSEGDTAAIQKMLTDNGLTAYVANDCSGWEKAGLVAWNGANPKRITALDISGLAISTLDVSALTELTDLRCGGNPIAFLKLPSGDSLTVDTPEESKVVLDSFDMKTKQATLTASAPLYRYTFYQWKWGADSSRTDNPVTLTVSGDFTVTADFRERKTPEYNPGDVEIIRGLIRDLNVNSSEDPAEWAGTGLVAWSNNANDKRVTKLTIRSQSVAAYRYADLRGLTELLELDCGNSKLLELKVAGLSKLWWIDCSDSLLRSLDVSGCASLGLLQADRIKTLTSYTEPGGRTASVSVTNTSSEGGTAYLQPDASTLTTVKVTAEPERGWYTGSISKATLDLSTADASAAVTFARITAPGAPQKVSATGGENQAALAWEPPSFDGGELTGYEVTHDNWATIVPLKRDAASYTFTDLAAGIYTLKVRAFNTAGRGLEASAACTVTDETPPVLSDGSALRISDTEATVTFKSSEAGTYYYVVAEEGTAKPTIGTSGAGSACVAGMNTITLDALSGGAKDIYIKAKDAAGNVSGPLQVAIPAAGHIAEYHPGDVAVVDGIIDNSNLKWTKNDPGSWPTTGIACVVWDDSSTSKRIKELYLPSISLSGTLNLTDLTSLQELSCCNNRLTTLNVSGLNSLQTLYCYDNPFQSLKLPGGETLTVNIDPERSGSVELSYADNLISNKSITLTAVAGYGYTFDNWTGGSGGRGNSLSLTLSGNTTVTARFIMKSDNEYDPGDVAVINGIIDNNGLTWQKNNPGSWPTNASDSPFLRWDDSGKQKRITYLSMFKAGLFGKLDVSSLTSLQKLYCYYNDLTGLDVTGLTSLEILSCSNNPLVRLDVVDLTSLKDLMCGNCSLNEMNLTGLTALKNLNCSNNSLDDLSNLNDLNVSGASGLGYLDCSGNSLSGTLDVTSLTNLWSLNCSGNSLDGLNLTGLTALYDLNCENNSLNKLNLTDQHVLHGLFCSDNNLTMLDMSSLPRLKLLYCYDNPFQSLKLPGGETLTVNIDPANSGTVMFSHDPSKGLIMESKTVTLAATAEPGYIFTGWTTSSGVSLEDKSSSSTTFTMPASAATVTANFRSTSGGGSTSRPRHHTRSHTHRYGAGWEKDVDRHWHECTAGDGARFEEAAHTAGDWIVDKPATETEAGSKHKECTVCGYVMQTESIAPTGSSYPWQTLIDKASGVRVSGSFTSDAKLEVKEMLLHPAGTCDVCDNIRERQENGELIVLFDIALKSGSYTSDLTVEIPVGEGYNGQTVIILHCKDKVLDSRTLTVENGMAKGTFTSLSPFAVAKVPASTVITGLPESYTLPVGRSVSWTPSPAGGAWSYDTDLLEMARQGDTYTFKALKEGKAAATYTVDGVPFTVTIAVNASTIPHTGDTTSTLPWALLMLAALGGAGGLLAWRRFGCKKRRG